MFGLILFTRFISLIFWYSVAFTLVAWGGAQEGRSKRNPSYSLCSTSGANVCRKLLFVISQITPYVYVLFPYFMMADSQVFFHTMSYDIKSMHYSIGQSMAGFPSRGFVRKYQTTCFDASAAPQFVFRCHLIVFNMALA